MYGASVSQKNHIQPQNLQIWSYNFRPHENEVFVNLTEALNG